MERNIDAIHNCPYTALVRPYIFNAISALSLSQKCVYKLL